MSAREAYWNGPAKRYSKSPIDDPDVFRHTIARTRPFLGQSDHVLELGCGTGSATRRLAPFVAHMTASDISTNMIRIARQKSDELSLDNIHFKIGSLFDERIEDETYDLVVCFNLLHLVEDLHEAIEHIATLVRPGGYFISNTFCWPAQDPGIRLKAIWTMLRLMEAIGIPPTVSFITASKLERPMLKSGFDVVEAHSLSMTSRFIVAKKR